MKEITHEDSSCENLYSKKWNLVKEGVQKEGDCVEFNLNGIIEKYLYTNGELCKYFWNGSKWVFTSKELYNIHVIKNK